MDKRGKILSAYWESVHDVLDWFTGTYFSEEGEFLEPGIDYFVVPSFAFTGPIHIADYFISWEEIEYCIKENIPKETFFAWLEYTEKHEYKPPINYRTFFVSYPNLPCVKTHTT